MKKIFLTLIALVIGGFMITSPVFADCPKGCVPTSILGENGCSCDSGGDDILNIVVLVRDIMTVGIGILGFVGITIVGIQYLTAGGNEEKTRKAKRRLYEIIIGLVAYAILVAVSNWLWPGERHDDSGNSSSAYQIQYKIS